MQAAARSIGISVLLALCSLNASAERLPIRVYSAADGLADENIRRIVRDSRGFLWLCTHDGLSRFDGYSFTTFGTAQGLPHPAVNDLLETRAGHYWIATGDGLARFNPAGVPNAPLPSGRDAMASLPMFVVMRPSESPARASSITVVREGRDGTIWIGTADGLYRVADLDVTPVLRRVEIGMPSSAAFDAFREVTDILEDASGSLWIATVSGLYRRRPDGGAVRYTTRDGLPNDFVQSLIEDHKGSLWVGTRLGGFFRLRAGIGHAPVIDSQFTYHEGDPAGLPTSWVFQLFEASDHRFWIATARGLLEFFPAGDMQGRHFQSYDTTNGLTDFDVTAIAEDSSGSLWLGTHTAGAMKLARDGLRSYGADDGIETVNAIFEDRTGRVCFRANVLDDRASFHIRLGCLAASRFEWFTPAVVTEMGWVTEGVTLQSRSGEWWVGTGEGVYRFPAADSLSVLRQARPLNHYTTTDGLAALQVFRLFEDSRGCVWISTIDAFTTNGLVRWERQGLKLRDLAGLPGLPSFKENLARSFAEDAAGSVWIGFDHGLARYADGRFTFFGETEGLPAGPIVDIFVDRSQSVWLASARGGIVRVEGATTDRPRFIRYTTTQGLSSNSTLVLTDDLAGHLYIGGGRGLDRLDLRSGDVMTLTRADGLSPGSLRAAFRDRNGELWFGTTRGLSRLAPSPERPAVLPPILIAAVRVGGTTQRVSAVGERTMSLGDLQPSHNHLQIDFLGLSFEPGNILRYQFKLDGADLDWSPPVDQRTVTYARLAAGHYTFKVRAVMSNGVVSATPATVSFAILHPVWMRWWFLALAAVALVLVIDRAYRYRAARQLDLANLRTRIASDLHDDIGANLTRIALLSDVAQQTGLADPVASIAHIARESVSSMSDIVWAINPARDSLRDLIRRLRRHAEEVFALRGIQLRFTAPGADDSFRLGPDVRRDLLLIFKEAINNGARHGHCSRVDVQISVTPSRLDFVMTDNGVGFEPTTESEGQGLPSMRRRAQRLGARLEIDSRRGGGTSVTLSMTF